MTLNITKKKIEKVLELFNHPQTRKIRKNRGKKRRRNNKSFNRKNGRKNLATSTLKKRGGHPILNGGQVSVVLGGQVGGNFVKNIITKLFSSENKKTERLKKYIREKEDENKKNQFVVNLINKIKEEEFNDINDVNSIEDSDFSIVSDVVNVFEDRVTVNNKSVDDEPIGDNKNNYITLDELKGLDIDINDFVGGPNSENAGTNGTNGTNETYGSDRINNQPTTEPEPETKPETKPQNSKSDKKVEKPKEESKNDKMMKLLTLREDYTIFNILNNLLPPKEEGQTADLKEIVKKLDFGKFVDEIGILKNDEEESTINEGQGKGEVDNDNEEGKGDGDREEQEEVDNEEEEEKE